MLGYIIRKIKVKTLCCIIISHVLCYFVLQVVLSFNEPYNSHFPVLVWWTDFMPFKDRTISCSGEVFKCLITQNRSQEYDANLGAYLFYGSRVENHDFPLPRNTSISWAVFHEESPKNYAPFLYKDVQSLFNITSTFSRYSDFPVTLQYLSNRSLLTDTRYYLPVGIKNEYLNHLSPILYIQSDCDTPTSRDVFVRELGKFVNIDSYGKCLTNKTFPKEIADIYALDLYNEKFLQFVSRYKFTVAFENAICDDYITEKLWRPLIVGSIPIYLGSPTVLDWLPNENSAILVKNYKNLEATANFIKKINRNDTLYESFLEHKIKSRVTNPFLAEHILEDHPIPAFECFVCKSVHRNNQYFKTRENVYNCPRPSSPDRENTWGQHWATGRCQAKALKLLIDRGRKYSADLFDQTWKILLAEKKC